MTHLTLSQLWLQMFHFFGAIRFLDAIWVFSIIIVSVALFHCKGFWKGLGYFNLIVGGLYLLLRIFGKI